MNSDHKSIIDSMIREEERSKRIHQEYIETTRPTGRRLKWLKSEINRHQRRIDALKAVLREV